MTEDRVYRNPSEAFLVCDPSLERGDAPFFRWLRGEGFELGDSHGCFGCPWCYVHLSRKRYAYGMPGVAITRPIGGHAITLEEFRTIYGIYRKYQGKEIFVFREERFDSDAFR